MEEICHKEVSLGNAVKIISDTCGHHIWRFELDSYLLTSGADQAPLAAFKSLAFPNFVKSLDSDPLEFLLIRGEALNNKCFDDLIELRLLTTDGNWHCLDTMDTIWKCSEALNTQTRSEVFTAMEVLYIPSRYPTDQMLFSANFLTQFIPYLTRNSASQVLSRFWAESHGMVNIMHATHIEGEFGSYAAVEQICGRVLFLAKGETTSLS